MEFLFQPFSSLPQEQWLFILAAGTLVSLMIGSFLNVVIYRLPVMMDSAAKEEAKWVLSEGDYEEEAGDRFNLAFPASRCGHCNTPIKAWQNIPVLSFLLLRAKCGSCKTKISWRYPLVELATAIIALLVMLQSDNLFQMISLLVLSFGLIALTMIDVDHQLLPDSLTLPLLWLGLLLNTQSTFVDLQSAVLGAAFGYLSLWSVYWLFKLITGKEGMGYGDFKLLAVFGAWFGWQILTNIILLSSVVGAIWGIAMIIALGRDSQKPMAFGPFIAVAGWLSFMYPAYLTVTNWLLF